MGRIEAVHPVEFSQVKRPSSRTIAPENPLDVPPRQANLIGWPSPSTRQCAGPAGQVNRIHLKAIEFAEEDIIAVVEAIKARPDASVRSRVQDESATDSRRGGEHEAAMRAPRDNGGQSLLHRRAHIAEAECCYRAVGLTRRDATLRGNASGDGEQGKRDERGQGWGAHRHLLARPPRTWQPALHQARMPRSDRAPLIASACGTSSGAAGRLRGRGGGAYPLHTPRNCLRTIRRGCRLRRRGCGWRGGRGRSGRG